MEYRVLNERLGAATHGNPIVLPKGTAKVVENWKCVRDNVYTKVRGRSSYGSGLPSEDFSQLMEYKSRLHCIMANNEVYFDSDGSGTFTQLAGTFAPPESGYKVDSLEDAGNLLMCTSTGVQKVDTLGGTVVNSGAPKGLSFDLRIINDVNWLSDTNTVAYRCVWQYEDENANLIVGAPSERQEITNSSEEDRAVELRIYIPNDVTTSYTLSIYRSTQVVGTPLEDFQLVYQNSPTSAEITAQVMEVNDILPDNWRGASLYTNTTQEGIAFANERPPLANSITSFKNYRFYGNIQNLHRLYTNLISVSNLSAGTSTITINDGTNSITIGFVAPNAGNTITNCANNGSGLIRVTSAGHGLTTGEWVRIYDVVGTTEANGIWEVTQIDANNFDLIGSTFTNAYTSGGTADLYEDIGSTPRAILYTSGADSQNIDSTAKSIVRCLNLISTNTYWYGYYNSTATDPVGRMEFVSQTLGSAAFYMTANSTTTGGNFSPIMPDSGTDYVSTNDDFQHAVMWSKEDEGEAVPLGNLKKLGSADDPILGIVGLRDSLFVIKENDGVYRLTGESPASWNWDEFDGTVECKQKNTIRKGENAVYFYSSDGYVRVTDVGVEVISRDKEKDYLKPLNASGFGDAGYAWYYGEEKAYKVATYEDQDSTSNDIVNEYNTFTNAWTQRRYGVYTNDPNVSLGIVIGGFEYTTPLTGNGLLRERKAIATTDYTLPDISNTIISVDTTLNTVTLGTSINIHQDAIITQGAVTRRITAVGTTAVYSVSSATGLATNVSLSVSNMASSGIENKIRVTTTVAHGLSSGNGITIAGVIGTTEANGNWVIDVIDATNIDLVDSEFINAYTSGGSITNTVTIKLGIYSSIKYQMIHCGYPEYLKTFDKVNIFMDDDETSISKLYLVSETDADKIDLTTTIDETDESVFEGEWSGSWGNEPITDKALTLLPEEHFRGSHLYLNIIHTMPQERMDLVGYSVLYDVVDTRYQQ